MSKKSENISFVHSFLNDREVFFGVISDYGIFKKDEFHKYTKAISELNEIELSVDERYKIAITIWEVSFKIERFLGSHFASDDPWSFENLDEDDPRQIGELIFYTANWFSYNKPMEKDHLKIGSWK
jgi:hypothetical protein